MIAGKHLVQVTQLLPPSLSVLVCSGCHNKIPQTRFLKQQKFTLYSYGGWKPKISMSTWWGFGEDSFPGLQTATFSLCAYMSVHTHGEGEEGEEEGEEEEGKEEWGRARRNRERDRREKERERREKERRERRKSRRGRRESGREKRGEGEGEEGEREVGRGREMREREKRERAFSDISSCKDTNPIRLGCHPYDIR